MKLINTSTSTGATALNLTTSTSKPPMVVNSKTKVANLNADLVDGKSAEQLTRVADMNAGFEVLPADGSSVVLGTPLTITAPTAGYVRINGNVTANNDRGSCNTRCAFVGYVRHADTGDTSLSGYEDMGALFYANVASGRVFLVNAGVNTFELRASRFGGGNGTIYGWQGNLNAEYTPYGSTGLGIP
jgi:hypothetical protein